MSGHTDGFRSLGTLLAGGDPRVGEAAFLEGLNTGSTINARNATTTNALAQARLRVDQAKDQNILRDLGLGATDVQMAQGGINPDQVASAAARRQIGGFREVIANPATSRGVAQRNAQAIAGTVSNPLQIAGGIFTDVFSDDPVGDIQSTPLGLSQIGANEARAEASLAAAALSAKRTTNPELFKSSTTVNFGADLAPNSLGTITSADIGPSTIPADIKPESATGIAGFGRAIANTAFDIINKDLRFPDADAATNALRDLAVRTGITGQQGIPGRPSNFLLQTLLGFGVDPNDPLRGDQKSLSRMQQTASFLNGEADNIERALNFQNGADMTPAIRSKNIAALRAIRSLARDYTVVISRFNVENRNDEFPFDDEPGAGITFTIGDDGT